jgi:hypothetical protein
VRVAYLGNFQPGLPPGTNPWSTESHVALSLEDLGHEVVRIQEGDTRAVDVPARAAGCNLLLWTQTFGLAVTGGTREERQAMLEALSMPTVGFHLDLWWGLRRAIQVSEREPFFYVDTLYTGDGGHDAEWAAAGVNHRWSPPGVLGRECHMAVPQRAYRSDVAFVGSWRGYDHAEHWPARRTMLEAVRRRYRNRFAMWPKGRAVRGDELNRLFASAKVIVGDSCLAGKIPKYWSDRIPETLGRGGFLIHPWVEGLEEHYTDGEHLRLYPAGDHAELLRLVDYYLAHDDERERIRRAGHEHVKAHHTYAHRMQRILSEVMAEVPT